MTEAQRNEFLKILQKSEEFLNGKLGTWKTDTVGFKLKYDAELICSHESEQVRTSTIQLNVVLDAEYKKADLNKTMNLLKGPWHPWLIWVRMHLNI